MKFVGGVGTVATQLDRVLVSRHDHDRVTSKRWMNNASLLIFKPRVKPDKEGETKR